MLLFTPGDWAAGDKVKEKQFSTVANLLSERRVLVGPATSARYSRVVDTVSGVCLCMCV